MSTFLSKHYPLRKIPTIALIKDLKDNKALINQILLSGIHFIQRKAPEFYNLGYYLKCLLTQFTGERIKAPHYFKVPFNKNVKVDLPIVGDVQSVISTIVKTLKKIKPNFVKSNKQQI